MSDAVAEGEGAEATPRTELRIINPDATAEEVAALVAVLSSLGGGTTPPRKPTSTWAARQRRTRPPLRPGPGSWRASGLPR